MLARRANIKVEYLGVDITGDIIKDLLSFRYTDNASGSADDIEISLKDEAGKWLNEWSVQKGDSIQAQINTINWRFNGDKQNLPCGQFIVDEPEYNGRPRIMSLKGISTPANSNFTTTKRSRSWGNIGLKAVAQDIAQKAGLKLSYLSGWNPAFDWLEQTEVSDMAFLTDICQKQGMAFKVTNRTIVIFNEAEYEKRPSVATFSEKSSSVLNYSLKTTLTDTAYAGCRVKYHDPVTGSVIDILFALKEIDPEKDKIYEVNTRAKTGIEARRIAQTTLRKLNKHEYVVNLMVVGNTDLVGSACVNLKDFGVFDGKYYIDKASHNLGGGYTTDMEMHKVLEGY